MNPRRVLIVEDEMVVQLHLSRIVGELGHELVGTAMNAREAVAIAERETPELVLMDIHLADGDDGVDTAHAILSEHDCAVVFVTAYADEATIQRTERVGAAGYLVKPFTAPAVRAAISTALAGYGRLQRAQSEARSLASALESLTDAFFLLDESGSVRFANPKACALVGRSSDEAQGRRLLEIVSVPAEGDWRSILEAMEEARTTRSKVSRSRIVVRHREGAEHTLDFEIEPVQGEAPDESGGLIVTLRPRSPGARRAHDPARTGKRAFGAGTRVLVYSHDTFGLGHLHRSLVLIRALCARHPGLSVLLVTGSPMVHRYALPDGVDYVKLPAVRKVESERYEARTLNVSGTTIRSMRSNLILHTLRDFDPDFLLVDHSPTGSRGELLPALEWLAQRGGCTRIVGLRDIIDEPAALIAQWKKARVYDALREHYDHLVVYGQRDVYDPVACYRFPDDVAARTRFVHYVCDRSAPAAHEPSGDGRPVVVVSIGGGDGGGETVIVPFLQMMRRFRREIDFRAEIVTGPFVQRDLEARLRALVEGLPVELHGFHSSTASLFRRAELVVATAGYNTSVDLLQNARSAVFVPRVLYRQEQLMRARRFEELGLATCLHPDDATPERLFETIQRARRDDALARARAEARMALDGADRFAEFCASLQANVRSGS